MRLATDRHDAHPARTTRATQDSGCFSKCDKVEAACFDCLAKDLGTGVEGSSCKAPVCATQDAGIAVDSGDGAKCAALSACCVQVADAENKSNCEQVAASGNGLACEGLLKNFTDNRLCK